MHVAGKKVLGISLRFDLDGFHFSSVLTEGIVVFLKPDAYNYRWPSINDHVILEFFYDEKYLGRSHSAPLHVQGGRDHTRLMATAPLECRRCVPVVCTKRFVLCWPISCFLGVYIGIIQRSLEVYTLDLMLPVGLTC